MSNLDTDMTTSYLSQDQARALFESGSFVLVQGLPEGAEFGIDGQAWTVRKLEGLKFVPPGLHLIVHSPPDALAKSAHFIFLAPQQTLSLTYDPSSESVTLNPSPLAISSDHLRALDAHLAPYPLEHAEQWHAMTAHLTEETVRRVVGEDGAVDSLMQAEAESEGEAKEGAGAEKTLKLSRVELKRSWRDGAVGEEVTLFSKDKSWAFWDVVDKQLGGEPLALLAHLELSFLLSKILHNPSALLHFESLLTLLARSHLLFSPPSAPSLPLPAPTPERQETLQNLYLALLHTLSTQLTFLRPDFFAVDLPGQERVWLTELENLRVGLRLRMDWSRAEEIREGWEKLRKVGERFGWSLDGWDTPTAEEEDDGDMEEEDEEDRPVVVELD